MNECWRQFVKELWREGLQDTTLKKLVQKWRSVKDCLCCCKQILGLMTWMEWMRLEVFFCSKITHWKEKLCQSDLVLLFKRRQCCFWHSEDISCESLAVSCRNRLDHYHFHKLKLIYLHYRVFCHHLKFYMRNIFIYLIKMILIVFITKKAVVYLFFFFYFLAAYPEFWCFL